MWQFLRNLISAIGRRRLLFWRMLCVAVAIVATLLVIEQVMEFSDLKRLDIASESFADTRFGRVRYRAVGMDLDTTPIVFLNGATLVLEGFARVQNAILRDNPTIAYDRGGTGFSTSTAYSAEEQADELADLLDNVKVKRPVLVVAYSISASVARAFAIRHRERTQGLFLIDPDLPEFLQLVPTAHGLLREYGRWYLTDTIRTWLGVARIKWLITGQGPNTMAPPELRDRASIAMLRSSHWWAADRELLASSENAEYIFTHASCDVPVTVLVSASSAGSGDGSQTTYRRAVDRVVSRSKRGRVVPLSVSDHTALITDPTSLEVIISTLRESASNANAG